MLLATRPVDTSRCMAEAGAAHSFAEQAKTEPGWGFFATLFLLEMPHVHILDAGRSLGTMQRSGGRRKGKEGKGEDDESKRLCTGVGQMHVVGWAWRQASGNRKVHAVLFLYGWVGSQYSSLVRI